MWNLTTRMLLKRLPDSPVPHMFVALFAMVTGAIFCLTGCGSPPAITPLLRVSQAAMAQEIEHLQTDVERDNQHIQQTLNALDTAFSADLVQAAENEQLTPEWVEDAMAVYVPAREAVVRHEASLQQQRLRRQENLQAAMLAQNRAQQLLEKQDQLITQSTHFNVWKLLALENPLVLENK